jgi:putative redox protein
MVQVTTRHCGDMLFENRIGRHTIAADVPPEAGGQDRGPTGTELLAAAIGSCVAAAVAYHGGRAGADMADVTVEVTCEWAARPLRMADFQLTIHMPHVTDPAVREALLEAAGHCPVLETLAAHEPAVIRAAGAA